MWNKNNRGLTTRLWNQALYHNNKMLICWIYIIDVYLKTRERLWAQIRQFPICLWRSTRTPDVPDLPFSYEQRNEIFSETFTYVSWTLWFCTTCYVGFVQLFGRPCPGSCSEYFIPRGCHRCSARVPKFLPWSALIHCSSQVILQKVSHRL